MAISHSLHHANSSMQAIVSVNGRFELAIIPRPFRKGPQEVLVKVERISLNRGELTFPWAQGTPAGWDACGLVIETSDDGQGPSVGTRVSTWSFSGGWAEYRVVDHDNLAIVPEGISPLIAAALPVVGLTALRALRQLKLEAGQSLAITGATGGVGHVLMQLARSAGLKVTAIVRDDQATSWLKSSGTGSETVVGASGIATSEIYDAVIDTVGGDILQRLIPAVRPEGIVLIVGNASSRTTDIDTSDLVSRRIDLLTYKDYSAGGGDIADLLNLVAERQISLHVTDAGDWKRLTTEPAETLIARGKATFAVTGQSATA